MGIKTKTVTECSCDICQQKCDPFDGVIRIIVNYGDGQDVGPATIDGKIYFNQPYGCSNGVICAACKKKYLSEYINGL